MTTEKFNPGDRDLRTQSQMRKVILADLIRKFARGETTLEDLEKEYWERTNPPQSALLPEDLDFLVELVDIALRNRLTHLGVRIEIPPGLKERLEKDWKASCHR